MAKDPAFLFYSQDFFMGTFSMTDEQVGKYIRLLCLQHQKKELSESDMINICKTYDEDIFSKFFKTSRGTYYNKRLKEEMDRRERYSESRRKNRLSKTYVKHMETETETETKTKKEAKKIKESRHKFGEYKNVLLTDTQHKKLESDYNGKLEGMIKNLDEAIQMKGYKYKDHNLVLRKWFPLETFKNGEKIISIEEYNRKHGIK